ncbi:MAG: hypothetical protein KF887_09340 [Paracoccaceae bacterium]|nr:MAG: hypothetical protein KF887_09340 [Paracoccaceae bacterium]
MDFGGVIRMIINRFLRRGVNTAINKGIRHTAAKGKAPKDMTPAERDQAARGRELAKRARQAARVTRRLGK